MAVTTDAMGDWHFLDVVKEDCSSVLIPGLPDDLAILCLVRVPRRYHHLLQGVCRRWREFLWSELFCTVRKRLGLAEGWIYALIRDISECLHWYVLDPTQWKWRELPGMPAVCSRRYGMTCEVVGRKLYLIGGCGRFDDPTNEVHVYDPLQNRWKEAAGMRTARCHCVSGVLDGRVYSIGGSSLTSGDLTSWEVYDSCTDQWVSYNDPNIVPDLGESLVLDGRIYVRHVSPTNMPPLYAAVYDPVKDIWITLDDEMTRRWCGPAVLLNNDVYMLDQTFGIKLMVLDKQRSSWLPVGRISPFSIRPSCQMAVVGNTLFVVGRGLKTLALDMDMASNSPGFLLTSSIMGLACSEDVIISCNTIEI
eukprot:c16430_g1_i1 orf=192-1280(-)